MNNTNKTLEIELNKVFRIEKGSRNTKWKAIEHPSFDNAFALVKDHPLLMSGDTYKNIDEQHTVAGAITLEKLYQMAYDHT